jgi:hypothetical protein
VVVNDENNHKVIVIGLKGEKVEINNKPVMNLIKDKLVVKIINTQIGYRTQVLNEKEELVDMNRHLI